MLEKLLPFEIDSTAFILSSLLITAIGVILLYIILFYILRTFFRRFERDIALVTLSVSSYPALTVFFLFALKVTFIHLGIESIENLLTATIISVVCYWLVQLLNQVLIYYLRDYTEQTEVMWDDVLLPLVEAVVPVIIIVIGSGLVLRSFGIDLTGIWVALGGATFIIGFAVQDILANFFSGIVLLIDTPFSFGDVLCLEDGSLGMMKKIGVRVTKLYMFNSHCDIYIPNSNLQTQNITNLSRPTAYYYHSTSIELPLTWDLDRAKIIMEEIILAHPDALGDIARKLELIDKYYQDKVVVEQQNIGKLRLVAEQEINSKLEEITAYLESLVLTIQFAESGGLTADEIANIQEEYQVVLSLIGLDLMTLSQENGDRSQLQETKTEDGLIELVREWYRVFLRDPNLLGNDQNIISENWERRINLLTKRAQKLWQTISNPELEETRLDDYVLELVQWLKVRFKQVKSKWQQPQVKMGAIKYDGDFAYVEFQLNYYVDVITLEDGRRGIRLSSQIHQEIVRYFKKTYPNWGKSEDSQSISEDIVPPQNHVSINASAENIATSFSKEEEPHLTILDDFEQRIRQFGANPPASTNEK
ncbi:MAG: mechanosensitive ion channel family protein [Xenococcus sp. (in: cyanobacteria)]